MATVSVPSSLRAWLSAPPWFGALAARPLVGDVHRLAAIVNGTSNSLLTRLAESRSTFAAALAEAQRAGDAEPDACRDVEGLDAADKLTLLASLFGWGRLSCNRLEVKGIAALTCDDLEAARTTGGAIKPIVWAARRTSRVEAFVGPALLSSGEPLASLNGPLNGIRLDGTRVSNVFFSGPGAGPDVMAATLRDDSRASASQDLRRPIEVFAPKTPWFIRLTFPGIAPGGDSVERVASASGLNVEGVVPFSRGTARWLLVDTHPRSEVDLAARRLVEKHRVETLAIRRIT